MTKASKKLANETTLEQQKRGVNTLSGVTQIGVGIAVFAASAFTGLPLYLAAPIASGAGVIGNYATNYLVSSNIGEGKENGVIAKLAGTAARQSDRLVSYLPRTLFPEDKKDPETAKKLSDLQDNSGKGLTYMGGALTFGSVAIDVAKSFFPIPTPPITTTILPVALSAMHAGHTLASGSKEALKDTTVGDAQEALGAIAERNDKIVATAVKNHVATSVANIPVLGGLVQGLSIVSAAKSMISESQIIWKLTMSGKKNAAEAQTIAKKSSYYHQANSSIRVFMKVAIVVGLVLLVAATGGAAAGITGLAVLTPAVIGAAACVIGALAGTINYYYHGNKTVDQVIKEQEEKKAIKEKEKDKEKGQKREKEPDLESHTREAGKGLEKVTHHSDERVSKHATLEQAAVGLEKVTHHSDERVLEHTTVEQAAVGLENVTHHSDSKKGPKVSPSAKTKSKAARRKP
jgi:hypothetical protein